MRAITTMCAAPAVQGENLLIFVACDDGSQWVLTYNSDIPLWTQLPSLPQV